MSEWKSVINNKQPGTVYEVRHYEHLYTKLASQECNLTFLQQCNKMKIIPDCLKIERGKYIQGAFTSQAIDEAEKIILSARIKDCRKSINEIKQDINTQERKVSSLIHTNELQILQSLSSRKYKQFKQTKIHKQRYKLGKLNLKNQDIIPASWQKSNIKNLTDYKLTTDEEEALCKGLNFCFGTNKKVRAYTDIVIALENAISMNDSFSNPLSEDVKQDLRERVRSNIIRHKKKPPKLDHRLIKYQKLIKNLKTNQNIHILKADKGNATVIMKREEYEEKMNDLLNKGPYRELKSNPTSSHRKTVHKFGERILHEKKISKLEWKKMTTNNARTPVLYGAPKIHKNGTPMRPIVSSFNSPTQQLSKVLHGLLKPIVGNNELSVRNSVEFKEKIKSMHLKRGEVLISYDATSLFTSIPVDKLLEFTREALEKDDTLHLRTKLSVDDILQGMELCLRSTFFQFRGKFFEQLDGMAMGCPLSTIGADIFMEKLEETLIKNNPQVKFYCRFVDDICMVIRKRQTNNILKVLNSFDRNVQFTYEVEIDNKLPFLDVLIHKKEDGTLKFSIFRKGTHTDKYLDWYSCHPKAHKITVVNTLIQRALRICDDEFLEDEITYVINSLVYVNNYPKKWVLNHVKKIREKFIKGYPKIPEEEPWAILPYIPGLTENVARIITRSLGNPIGYIPYSRMSDIVTTHKDKDICPNCGIYKISCTCGSIYIGETGRDFPVRLKEHKDCVRLAHTDKSALSNHVWENAGNQSHSIEWANAKIIVREERYIQRTILESLMIKKAKKDKVPLMNRKEEEGRDWLPNFWNTLFYDILNF